MFSSVTSSGIMARQGKCFALQCRLQIALTLALSALALYELSRLERGMYTRLSSLIFLLSYCACPRASEVVSGTCYVTVATCG